MRRFASVLRPMGLNECMFCKARKALGSAIEPSVTIYPRPRFSESGEVTSSNHHSRFQTITAHD